MQEIYKSYNRMPEINPEPPRYTIDDLLIDLKQLSSGLIAGVKISAQVIPVASEIVLWQNRSFSSEKFVQLYSKCPALVVSDVKAGVLKYLGSRRSSGSSESIEEILCRFMSYSKDVNNPIFQSIDSLTTSTGAKVLGFLSKLFGYTGNLKEISPIFPIKPYLLAVLWAVLLTELSFKVMSLTTDSEIENMARFGVAITLGVICGVTGFFHSGGTVSGFKSPTSAIKTYYTTQRFIEEHSPSLYYKIPDYLKFSTPDSFDHLTSNEKISTGKGLNMAYTFRVGDAFLMTMEGRGIVNEEILKKVLRSVWPLVTSSESEKMYELYTKKSKLYFIKS